MNRAFRVRLNIEPAENYLQIDQREVDKLIRGELGKLILAARRSIEDVIPGVRITLNDVDRLEGEWWTPYDGHDPDRPADTGYHIVSQIIP